MINNYFRPSVTRPTIQITYNQQSHSPYLKPYGAQKYRKYKLLVSLIVKAAQRHLSESFQLAAKNTKIVPQALHRLTQIIEKNNSLSVFLAF